MTVEELNAVLDRVSHMLDTEGVPNVEALTLCDMVLSEVEKESGGKMGAMSAIGGAAAAIFGLASGLGLFLPGVLGAYLGFKAGESKNKADFGPIILRAQALKARADNIKP